jgi:hypothetical protein
MGRYSIIPQQQWIQLGYGQGKREGNRKGVLEGINSFPIIILMKGNGKRKWVVDGARPGLGAG